MSNKAISGGGFSLAFLLNGSSRVFQEVRPLVATFSLRRSTVLTSTFSGTPLFSERPTTSKIVRFYSFFEFQCHSAEKFNVMYNVKKCSDGFVFEAVLLFRLTRIAYRSLIIGWSG